MHNKKDQHCGVLLPRALPKLSTRFISQVKQSELAHDDVVISLPARRRPRRPRRSRRLGRQRRRLLRAAEQRRRRAARRARHSPARRGQERARTVELDRRRGHVQAEQETARLIRVVPLIDWGQGIPLAVRVRAVADCPSGIDLVAATKGRRRGGGRAAVRRRPIGLVSFVWRAAACRRRGSRRIGERRRSASARQHVGGLGSEKKDKEEP